ncbi:MAG: hypothetical protein ABIP76_13210 [Verrucomicrobiota bacterium]
MKRSSDDDDQRHSTPDAKLEAFFSNFLQRHPKFFLYVGVGLVILIIVALVVAKFTNKNP